MRSVWSEIKGRVSNRLARHLASTPLRLPDLGPMVSFTFDDAPDSAAETGAPLLEAFGGRGTFYLAGSLVDQPSDHWLGISREAILALHHGGHEIACHTYSHRRAGELDEAGLAAEIEKNRDYFNRLDPSIRLENFAYPFGFASLPRKIQLTKTFRSSRGIQPGVNRGVIDLQFLHAIPLIEHDATPDDIDRAFDQAVTSNGWLIFYSHDVTNRPSPFGCSPAFLRHALERAARHNMPIVTVAEALRRIGA
ncbi:MAG: polysaccharide deacetylase family protein [Bradyrhizobium sp.]|uniref:polysaccharide deacetylase family protein n=1 Tax=Bradyrhizobium sp. TaxID=376 RepID=UPI0025C19639|nr:polysaccharide deacetylase family protein [Bradyrhizobium sp.]MBI5260813.1 polysaccharide deacetylase family protein [Bradyrhizobium sp.]